MQHTENAKLKVLALGDYGCSTGFATVMSNIMRELDKTGRFEIDVVGINYTGDPYDQKKFPGKVWPAMNIATAFSGDVYGRQRYLDFLGSGNYDIAFILQDTFIVKDMMDAILETQKNILKKFKTILYFPIDASPKKEWVDDVVAKIDYPVAYTNYAKGECQKIDPKTDMEVIYHGTNLKDFNYLTNRDEVKKFRHNYWGGKAERFLITNVNRNQSRKDIIRNFMILNELKRRGRKAAMYLHMSHDDQGGNILVMADHFNLKLGEDFMLPSPKFFNSNQGLPIDILNYIYNASDCLLSTTLGEGWGLSITEAMATKTPVVAPDNTSLTEMLADNRGYLVKAGANPSMWIMKELDNERLRPLMDVEDAADKIEMIMDGKKPDIEGAYKWAQGNSWANICKQWTKIFEKAGLDARTEDQKMNNRAERRRRELAERKLAKKGA